MMPWREVGIGTRVFAFLTMMAVVFVPSAFAQTDTVTVDIPPQDLSSALKAFAEQSNQQVLYASDLTRGLTTKEVVGTVTPQEAVRQLLEGTA